MHRFGSLGLILSAVALVLPAAGPAAAQSRGVQRQRPPQSQGERIYRGHYFNWQQSYDGRIFAWMSQDTYQVYSTVGYGTRASGAFTVTAGNVVYVGTRYGQSGANGLVLVELRRSTPTPPVTRTPTPPAPAQGCPPGDTYWNVYVQADAGYNYQFKVVVRATGEAVYVMWSGDPMHWVQATGSVRGNQLIVNSIATVTDDRGQAVKLGGSLRATLTPDCSEGQGRTEAGRVPGVNNADGNIRVARYN